MHNYVAILFMLVIVLEGISILFLDLIYFLSVSLFSKYFRYVPTDLSFELQFLDTDWFNKIWTKLGSILFNATTKKIINKVDTLECNWSHIYKPLFLCNLISVLIYSVITLSVDSLSLGKWGMEVTFCTQILYPTQKESGLQRVYADILIQKKMSGLESIYAIMWAT